MSGYPTELSRRVDDYLRELRFSTEPRTSGLEEAMRHSLLAGGKRIRPVLSLATAESLGMSIDSVMPLACAIELIHTYSLIHDDLPAMDDDDLRRGQPTCHVKYGENVAILAGDALFAEAFRLVLERQEGDPARLVRALAELARATGAGGMVGGQFMDVKEWDVDAAGLRRLHELKTGKLIAAAIVSVLLLSNLGDSAGEPYGRFAAELGVLFQIVDDILDVTGSEDALGKSPGSDERLGRRTYVSVFGLERARSLASESHGAAQAALDDVQRIAGGSVETLRSITDFIYTRTS